MAKNQRKVGEAKSEVVEEMPLACADESAAVEFMEKHRWGDEPACPNCGDTDVYKMRSREGCREKNYRWRCRGCGKLYSVRTGTVMEDSRIPMRHWCYAFWRATTSKKGVAALEIQRQTGLSYKSALFMMHRIRFAMEDGPESGKLNGTVEVDETYVGGKPRHKGPHNPRGTANKQPVMAMVERGGRVRTRVVPDVTAKTLKATLRELVDEGARVMTDEHASYTGIGEYFPGGHHVVNHSAEGIRQRRHSHQHD